MNRSNIVRPIGFALPVLAAVAALLAAPQAKSDVAAATANPSERVTAAQGEKDTKKEPVSVLYAGFSHSEEDGARVFVRATGEVPVLRRAEGRKLTYHFEGAKLGTPNSANPLLTDHFKTEVSRVALVSTASGVALEIDLRQEPTESQGLHRWLVSGQQATLNVEFPRSK